MVGGGGGGAYKHYLTVFIHVNSYSWTELVIDR